ncbi:3-hydroxyacyl-ACP dehydratase FabZ family protein [Saccharothrix isguenensis]
MSRFDIGWIESVIPHRDTMLLIDRVTELTPGESVEAVKAVTYTEPWYRGSTGPDLSYPLPLLLESWNQAAAVLVLATWAAEAAAEATRETAGRSTTVGRAGVPMLGSYGDVTLVRPVTPGDTMVHTVRIDTAQSDTMVLSGRTCVNNEVTLMVDRGIVIRRPMAFLVALRAPSTPELG